MRFFVTGANGYLGARLYQDLKTHFETYGSYHKEPLFKELIKLDVSSEQEVVGAVDKVNPEIIVHAAAVPTPKAMSEDPEYARRVNVEGTKNILRAASRVGAKVIYISTNGAIKPFDDYTRTKADSEKLVERSKDYLIIRPALVLGGSPNTTNDRQQNRFIKNILGTKEPVYDNSTQLQVTWIGHISEVIELAAKRQVWGHTIPISAEDRKTRYEIARDVLGNFGVECAQTVDKPGGFLEQGSEKLRELGFPVYDYGQVIEKTVAELRISIRDVEEKGN
ncbi:MAG: sugar nucleotide-binding protein, partial [Candidatus Micrarchaeota archaeon]|nr:sugar nucleotide-binding protein [Candidatus Micrarchaeota archaeon]